LWATTFKAQQQAAAAEMLGENGGGNSGGRKSATATGKFKVQLLMRRYCDDCLRYFNFKSVLVTCFFA